MLKTGCKTGCPWCGQKIATEESKHPSSGDVVMCIDCGRWSVFSKDLFLRVPTFEEYIEMSYQAKVQHDTAAWRNMIGGML